MNKTEAKYALELEGKKRLGEIQWYGFECITLKIADGVSYKPDFLVMDKDGELSVHEVKGFFMDDAKVKTKAAADKFPFRFFVATLKKASDGGGWNIVEF